MRFTPLFIALLLFISPAQLLAAIEDCSGWWFVPSESGTGISLGVQGNLLYMCWYLYDDEGRNTWYSALLSSDDEITYQGEMYEYTGWPLSEGYQGQDIVPQTTGSVNIEFLDINEAVLTWTGEGRATLTKQLSRYFTDLTTPEALDGWWISDQAPGLGWFLEAKENTFFVGWPHYREDGSARWYIFLSPFDVDSLTHTGDLLEYSGGQSLTGPYQEASGWVVGQADITLPSAANPDTVTVAYDGQTWTLSKWQYNQTQAQTELSYPVVDTGQDTCFDLDQEIAAPEPGEPFYGQDAQHQGNQPSYTLSDDGKTVYDTITGLTWTQSPDINGDGAIDADDKLYFADFLTYPATLNAQTFGGYDDWRAPSIKELYSLMDFRGTDPSGMDGDDASGLIPYIDTNFFAFGFGDTSADERIIDAQFWSSNAYVGTVFGGQSAAFGLNLADGRIKGYPTAEGTLGKVNYVYFVRGNTDYGVNSFADNGDGTITDSATGLMWTQDDSETALNWQEALAWVQAMNDQYYLGYGDWRLPNAKELQSIADYSRAPDVTDSPAIDPLFNCTQITNEGGAADYPCYWSSTTHMKYNGIGDNAAYVAFGRGLGYMNGQWMDVHGAGCQRSDPKAGDPNDYPTGHGPQGDAIRIYNYVRMVRDK